MIVVFADSVVCALEHTTNNSQAGVGQLINLNPATTQTVTVPT
jgi:hypothetical protein